MLSDRPLPGQKPIYQNGFKIQAYPAYLKLVLFALSRRLQVPPAPLKHSKDLVLWAGASALGVHLSGHFALSLSLGLSLSMPSI